MPMSSDNIVDMATRSAFSISTGDNHGRLRAGEKKTRQIIGVLVKKLTVTSSEISTHLRPGGKPVGLDLRWNAA